MKQVQFRRAAEVELRQEVEWYASRNEEVARRFAEEVGRTIELIEQFPSIGGTVPGTDDPAIRRFPVRHFPYHVVFESLPRRTWVLAVAHDRKKPGYWR